EPGLVSCQIYIGYWFFGRPTVEDLRQDLRAATRTCRPDWDITKVELKAVWKQGRKELFYPYGKTYVQTLGEQDQEGCINYDDADNSLLFDYPVRLSLPAS